MGDISILLQKLLPFGSLVNLTNETPEHKSTCIQWRVGILGSASCCSWQKLSVGRFSSDENRTLRQLLVVHE